jgi:hypothetical protein
MDVKILVIDPDEPDEPLYEMRVDAGTDDPDEAGERAILAAAAELGSIEPLP